MRSCAPPATLTWLSANNWDRFPHTGGWILGPQSLAKHNQTLCPHQPCHSFQCKCPFALLPDTQPQQPSFSIKAPLWQNVRSTAWLLQPAGFPGIWIKVKIENKEGEEKRQAETREEKEDKVQKIGYRMLGRGWGMVSWYCHLVASWYSEEIY